ncbi:MAG: hydroxyacid dehydrogenase [Actinomycetota bacterium]|nr:hydroxyacid dehydrogenase [Actinomycetota bacterium]
MNRGIIGPHETEGLLAGSKPEVWFEREILSDLVEFVGEQATILGPASITPDTPYANLAAARGIVASQHRYDEALMDRAPNLRVISRTGIGYEKVDVAAATERGIAVCIAPDGPTISTAEHAIALLLMVAKNVKRSEAELRGGGSDFYARHIGIELDGATLGLVGFGRIARRVASMAQGLRMKVATYDPFLAPAGFPPEVIRYETIEALVAASDMVSIHVPLTEDNVGLFDSDLLALMKPGSILINTARGGLVDIPSLESALDAGHLFGAGLDVTEPEPLAPGHPLLARDDVVVTPHVAAGTAGAKRRIFKNAFEQVIQVLDGQRPPNLVNAEVWVGSSTTQLGDPG